MPNVQTPTGQKRFCAFPYLNQGRRRMINQFNNDDGLYDIPGKSTDDPAVAYELHEGRQQMLKMIISVASDELDVRLATEYFGIDTEDCLTVGEISSLLGHPNNEVRQRISHMIYKIRRNEKFKLILKEFREG